MGSLFIVATPIGNLKDITLRAIETLKGVDFILAEDTRVTKNLLAHYEISKPMISYHKFSDLRKIQEIKNLLSEGKNLALVTDAGTPGISDPGEFLIRKIIEDFPEVKTIPIPGSSALAAAISVCGFTDSNFLFMGFPPPKKRKKFFEKIKNYDCPIVLYESPYKLIKTLKELSEAAGGNREIFLAKEMTKIFEKFYRGTIDDVLNKLEGDAKNIKGEYVLIVNAAIN
ncbi:MAG: 16S rRNA (cytidine(1402)-2'-O)-methyltransferase [Patescibacteria group bacterium]|nr:16S rRNA (cytidine(1402)-2'-O)-methyltransferase [Patescibacteria group bacterium]